MEGRMTYKTRMKCIHHTFRVNGELNGVSIIAQDLNCYVVTEDGRTYTAISRISEKLGWQMQGMIEENYSCGHQLIIRKLMQMFQKALLFQVLYLLEL